ncbi:hypothetical protein J3R30DRAFT_1083823 [Lentinula aciculospora]|uniref:Uncharacterized protein n=1 Tax=Lentinula aciculospora TaxID=153920 RepID=A0A9W9A205_9AGAR|nr:hypothetical protein J3R30DRAFT_1083823 [Lentinula aciculospora]
MKPKQFKVKAPKFKIKEYKVPEYSKYVVVTNPWSKPTFLSGNGRRENERFANTIGGWFEKMTGQPVQTIYFQSNKEFIIVELEHNVDVNLILGAHHTQDFFKIPTRAEISEIYVYDKKDLMELRVKEKEDYPPPRKTKTSKPPTHFAQPLSSELQELITARRSSYEESQPASSICSSTPSCSTK